MYPVFAIILSTFAAGVPQNPTGLGVGAGGGGMLTSLLSTMAPTSNPASPQASNLMAQAPSILSPRPRRPRPRCKHKANAYLQSQQSPASSATTSLQASSISTTPTTTNLQQQQQPPAAQLQGITAAEVSKHATATDCYIIYKTTVYDMSAWVSSGHPGRAGPIQSFCGKSDDGFARAFEAKHGRKGIASSKARNLGALAA